MSEQTPHGAWGGRSLWKGRCVEPKGQTWTRLRVKAQSKGVGPLDPELGKEPPHGCVEATPRMASSGPNLTHE